MDKDNKQKTEPQEASLKKEAGVPTWLEGHKPQEVKNSELRKLWFGEGGNVESRG